MQRITVHVVREGDPDPAVQCAADLGPALIERLKHFDREHFLVVHLDVRSRPLTYETVSIGSLSASIVHPREVFKGAILANAASVILAHNHPSGDTTPSRDDLELTKHLVKAGELLGIEVVDHIIIGGTEHLSLKERGLL